MITYKQKEIGERVLKWNQYRKVKYNKPPEDTSTVYVIFRKTVEGGVPSTLYVGKTKQEMSKRLAQHMSDMKRAREGKLEWCIKTRWMHQVDLEKGTMVIAPLSIVPNSRAFEVEAEWIAYLGMAGFTMLNGDNSRFYNKVI